MVASCCSRQTVVTGSISNNVSMTNLHIPCVTLYYTVVPKNYYPPKLRISLMVHLFRRRDRQKAQQVQQVQQTQEEKVRKATQLLPETVLTQVPLPSGVPPEGRVVVTITRQFGSGGAEIAHMVAQESGLQYVDQGIIEEVARRLGVSAQQA